jgi:hypothetical protein
MSIPNTKFNDVIYLIDLNLYCSLFKRSSEQLDIASTHWLNISQGVDDGTKFSPLSIISECTVCLSSISAINRILYPAGKGIKQSTIERSKNLLDLLGEPDINFLKNKGVRNSWEHHDERLDKHLAKNNQKTKISDVYVSAKEPDQDTIVIRRFDPVNKLIYCFGDVIELHSCTIEVDLLIQRVKLAFENINHS